MHMLKVLALALLAPSLATAAAVPVTLSHMGYLLNGNDQPVTEPSLTLSFSVWKDVGSPDTVHRVWPETPISCPVKVDHGRYSLVLGAGCAPGLTSDHLPPGQTRWLEVAVAGSTLTPRLMITGTPTAAVAGLALSLPAGTVTNEMLAKSTVTITAGEGLSGGGTIALGDTTTLSLDLPKVGAAGSFTNANLTIDAQGRVTAAADGAPQGVTGVTAGNGLLGGTITTTGTIALPSVVTAGSFTNANLTIDTYGRVTAASNGAPQGVTSVKAGTGLDGGDITSAGTLSIAANGVDNTLLKNDLASLGKLTGGLLTSTSTSLGIGTTSPGEKLQVAGAIKLGTTSTPCNNDSQAGAVRWTGTALEVCVGALGGWRALAQAAGPHRFWRTSKTDGATGGGYHTELEVYAAGAKQTVTSSMLSMTGLQAWTPANMADGNTGSLAFHTDSAPAGSWMQIDFGVGNEKALSEWRYYTSGGVYATWSIQWSDNGSAWTNVASNLVMTGSAGWRAVNW